MANKETEASSWFSAEEIYLKAAAALLDSSSLDTEDTAPLPSSGPVEKKRKWVKGWLSKKEKGHYLGLLPDLLETDPPGYENFLRVDEELFTETEGRVRAIIEKQTTNMRASISAAERLSSTLGS